jgi:hypothetical protein
MPIKLAARYILPVVDMTRRNEFNIFDREMFISSDNRVFVRFENKDIEIPEASSDLKEVSGKYFYTINDEEFEIIFPESNRVTSGLKLVGKPILSFMSGSGVNNVNHPNGSIVIVRVDALEDSLYTLEDVSFQYKVNGYSWVDDIEAFHIFEGAEGAMSGCAKTYVVRAVSPDGFHYSAETTITARRVTLESEVPSLDTIFSLPSSEENTLVSYSFYPNYISTNLFCSGHKTHLTLYQKVNGVYTSDYQANGIRFARVAGAPPEYFQGSPQTLIEDYLPSYPYNDWTMWNKIEIQSVPNENIEFYFEVEIVPNDPSEYSMVNNNPKKKFHYIATNTDLAPDLSNLKLFKDVFEWTAMNQLSENSNVTGFSIQGMDTTKNSYSIVSSTIAGVAGQPPTGFSILTPSVVGSAEATFSLTVQGTNNVSGLFSTKTFSIRVVNLAVNDASTITLNQIANSERYNDSSIFEFVFSIAGGTTESGNKRYSLSDLNVANMLRFEVSGQTPLIGSGVVNYTTLKFAAGVPITIQYQTSYVETNLGIPSMTVTLYDDSYSYLATSSKILSIRAHTLAQVQGLLINPDITTTTIGGIIQPNTYFREADVGIMYKRLNSSVTLPTDTKWRINESFPANFIEYLGALTSTTGLDTTSNNYYLPTIVERGGKTGYFGTDGLADSIKLDSASWIAKSRFVTWIGATVLVEIPSTRQTFMINTGLYLLDQNNNELNDNNNPIQESSMVQTDGTEFITCTDTGWKNYWKDRLNTAPNAPTIVESEENGVRYYTVTSKFRLRINNSDPSYSTIIVPSSYSGRLLSSYANDDLTANNVSSNISFTSQTNSVLNRRFLSFNFIPYNQDLTLTIKIRKSVFIDNSTESTIPIIFMVKENFEYIDQTPSVTPRVYQFFMNVPNPYFNIIKIDEEFSYYKIPTQGEPSILVINPSLDGIATAGLGKGNVYNFIFTPTYQLPWCPGQDLAELSMTMTGNDGSGSTTFYPTAFNSTIYNVYRLQCNESETSSLITLNYTKKIYFNSLVQSPFPPEFKLYTKTIQFTPYSTLPSPVNLGNLALDIQFQRGSSLTWNLTTGGSARKVKNSLNQTFTGAPTVQYVVGHTIKLVPYVSDPANIAGGTDLDRSTPQTTYQTVYEFRNSDSSAPITSSNPYGFVGGSDSANSRTQLGGSAQEFAYIPASTPAQKIGIIRVYFMYANRTYDTVTGLPNDGSDYKWIDFKFEFFDEVFYFATVEGNIERFDPNTLTYPSTGSFPIYTIGVTNNPTFSVFQTATSVFKSVLLDSPSMTSKTVTVLPAPNPFHSDSGSYTRYGKNASNVDFYSASGIYPDWSFTNGMTFKFDTTKIQTDFDIAPQYNDNSLTQYSFFGLYGTISYRGVNYSFYFMDNTSTWIHLGYFNLQARPVPADNRVLTKDANSGYVPPYDRLQTKFIINALKDKPEYRLGEEIELTCGSSQIYGNTSCYISGDYYDTIFTTGNSYTIGDSTTLTYVKGKLADGTVIEFNSSSTVYPISTYQTEVVLNNLFNVILIEIPPVIELSLDNGVTFTFTPEEFGFSMGIFATGDLVNPIKIESFVFYITPNTAAGQTLSISSDPTSTPDIPGVSSYTADLISVPNQPFWSSSPSRIFNGSYATSLDSMSVVTETAGAYVPPFTSPVENLYTKHSRYFTFKKLWHSEIYSHLNYEPTNLIDYHYFIRPDNLVYIRGFNTSTNADVTSVLAFNAGQYIPRDSRLKVTSAALIVYPEKENQSNTARNYGCIVVSLMDFTRSSGSDIKGFIDFCYIPVLIPITTNQSLSITVVMDSAQTSSGLISVKPIYRVVHKTLDLNPSLLSNWNLISGDSLDTNAVSTTFAMSLTAVNSTKFDITAADNLINFPLYKFMELVNVDIAYMQTTLDDVQSDLYGRSSVLVVGYNTVFIPSTVNTSTTYFGKSYYSGFLTTMKIRYGIIPGTLTLFTTMQDHLTIDASETQHKYKLYFTGNVDFSIDAMPSKHNKLTGTDVLYSFEAKVALDYMESTNGKLLQPFFFDGFTRLVPSSISNLVSYDNKMLSNWSLHTSFKREIPGSINSTADSTLNFAVRLKAPSAAWNGTSQVNDYVCLSDTLVERWHQMSVNGAYSSTTFANTFGNYFLGSSATSSDRFVFKALSSHRTSCFTYSVDEYLDEGGDTKLAIETRLMKSLTLGVIYPEAKNDITNTRLAKFFITSNAGASTAYDSIILTQPTIENLYVVKQYPFKGTIEGFLEKASPTFAVIKSKDTRHYLMLVMVGSILRIYATNTEIPYRYYSDINNTYIFREMDKFTFVKEIDLWLELAIQTKNLFWRSETNSAWTGVTPNLTGFRNVIVQTEKGYVDLISTAVYGGTSLGNPTIKVKRVRFPLINSYSSSSNVGAPASN